jgi:glycosyl hydrolase family 26
MFSRSTAKAAARRRASVAAVVAAVLCLASTTAVGAARDGTPRGANAGVYAGPADPAGVQAFEDWLGKSVPYIMEFPDKQHWATIQSPWFIPRIWGRTSTTFQGKVLVLSVPMLPGNVGFLETGAAGKFNSHFRQLATTLKATGLADRTIIRLGWEFNSGWARWSAKSDPAAFAAYFRQIVTTMRRVAPGLRFDWCPAEGLDQFWGIAGGLAAAYPGDAYVDYIGLDVYDQAWGPNGAPIADPVARWKQIVNEPGGLAWQAAFGSAHHKPLSFPEWALTERADGHGGGDDPYFIDQMHAWFLAHDVAYQAYFDHNASDGAHMLESGQFPNAAAAFRARFGTS